ncbi:MAG: hypothetical protein QNK80_05075 [Akkermansiaceae bacterium]|jgi:hypothetical protein
MIPLRIIALLLGLFIFVGSAAELPPQMKVIQLKLKEKTETSNQKFLDGRDQLVTEYTQKEKFIWAIQAKDARNLLAQGKPNPDQNLPRAVKVILTQQKKMRGSLDRIYMTELERIRQSFVKKGDLNAVNQSTF